MSATSSPPALDFAALWDVAEPYERFVAGAERNRDLWADVYRLARVPRWAPQRATQWPGLIRLLVLAEDWCGDAVNTLPVLAKLADQVDHLDIRILHRDEHPTVMDQYLTRGARAIPVVIVLDEQFGERGHWGPRPSELQTWVMQHKDSMSSADRYREVRRWYAKDRGESTLREVLALTP
jgi:hypothetical protein